MKKKIISLILVAAMGLSLFGCSTPGDKNNESSNNKDNQTEGQTPAETGKKVLRYSMKDDAPTLDPQLMNSIPSGTVGYHIFEGLTRNHMGQIENGMAESWDVSEDGKTYTFHLRDAKWSDGEPITAYDYEYGFKRLADPATGSNFSFIITNLIKNAAEVVNGDLPLDDLGVKATDDKTLVVELYRPTEYFTSMLSGSWAAPVRKDLVEKYGKEFAGDADKNVYSGPFIVKEWKHNDRIILEKNPNFWNKDAIRLDEVDILTVADPNTAVAMYEKGELDIAEVPPEVLENYKDDVEYFFDGANDFIRLNMDGSCVLDNKDLRLAINYAINREDYILLTTNNLYQANTRYVLPQVRGAEKDYGDEYPYDGFPVKGDLDKAKDYLSKAMETLGVTDPSSIKLELLTTDKPKARKEVEVLQNQIQNALGITIEIRQVPYKQKLEMDANHEFQMSVGGWVPDYSDPMSYLELWTADSPYNQSSYKSDVYDGYIEASYTAANSKERMDALFNAEKTLLEDGALAPLQLRRVPLLINPKVKGFGVYFVGINYDYIYADVE